MATERIEGYPISPQQRRLWLLQRTSGAYRAQCGLLLEGGLDRKALQEALRKLVERYEILRTSFRQLPGVLVPFQVIKDRYTPACREVDLRPLDAHAQTARIERELRTDGVEPFDLEEGRPLRLSLLTLSADRHVLLMTLPALCADSRSLQNLLQEISGLYGTSLGEQKLCGDAFQYVEFAEWQNELAESEDENAKAGRAFWRSQDLDGVPAVTLPFGVAVHQETAFDPEPLALRVDFDLTDRIERFASAAAVSAADFLLSGWLTLVWRLTRRPELVVGTVVDGRRFPELHAALGLFAKSLPLHFDFDGRTTFAEVVNQVRDSTGKIYEWQDYFPWDEKSGAAGVESGFPVGFAFTQAFGRRTAAGLTFSLMKPYECLEPFKIRLSCIGAPGSLACEVQYDPAAFERETVTRVSRYLETLLTSAASDPDRPAGELEILTESDRRQLVIGFNRTDAEFPEDKCVHELFEEQVERTPLAVALVFDDQKLTYAECNARANRLARFLKKRGVGPDVCVALCVQRSVEMLVGLLGILKAGGAYVPLNPEHPKGRLAKQLADIHAPVLVTEAKLVGQLPDFNGEVVCLDRDSTTLRSEDETNLERTAGPDHLAYVIYTSGSTGIPKGVAITHRSLVNYTEFIKTTLRPRDPEPNLPMQFASVSTIGADLGNTCIFPSLVSGGCLHILSYDVATDGEMFARYVATHGIDVLKIVPSHLGALLAARQDPGILPRKYLILGGETLSWDLARRISDLNGECQIINHYGPTETTVGSLTFHLADGDASSRISSTVPIGRPIANTRIYILDEHLAPVPIGAPGRLCIAGAGLARGYLNQPEQTAQRFIPDPFTNGEGRVYDTGDLARYLPDGNVEFLGRSDDQVKIRGFRIELGEVQAALAQHPGVRESVVVASAAGAGEKRLIAYVVPARETAPARDELRRFLFETLPDYMVPSAFVILKALPLTRNGKVDRAALPAPEENRPDTEKAFVAPRTPTEEKLAEIWREVLELERVGMQENFFDLGGHSLKATQVIARLRTSFQIALPLQSLFESPTIEGLALAITGSQAEKIDGEHMIRLLAELEGLSDEEAQRLLSAEPMENDNLRTQDASDPDGLGASRAQSPIRNDG